MEYILLVVGFVILIKGGDIFVEGASKLAQIFKIPELLIGIIIVGIGTSLPEISVNVTSALKGSTSLATGNVVGSNIFNLLFIIGLVSLIKPLTLDKKMASFDFPVVISATILLPILAFNGLLSRFDGIIFLGIFIWFMVQTVRKSMIEEKRKQKAEFIAKVGEKKLEVKEEKQSLGKDIFLILVGLIAVIKGGDIVVESATVIAKNLGMSNHLIGLTVVGIGTSLPELVVCLIATSKDQQGIVIGNIIGSNIFNLLLVLGLTMTISPIPISRSVLFDTGALAIMTLVAGIFAITDRDVNKKEGAILVLMYVGYMSYTIIQALHI